MDESIATRLAKKMLGRVSTRVYPEKCHVSLSWLEHRLIIGKCEITGINFKYGGPRERYSPSIDRVDSSLGYTNENCRLVVLQYNLAKNIWTNQDVIQFAKDVLKNEKVTAIAAVADLKSALAALGAGKKFDEYWANVEDWLNG